VNIPEWVEAQLESPAERRFLMGAFEDSGAPLREYEVKFFGDDIRVRSLIDPALVFRIILQESHYKARFDFVFDTGSVRMAVEIDGHEWHERTKDQASRDRAKDRMFLSLGCPVIRFTGSDVYENAAGCFRAAFCVFRSWHARVSRGGQ
jgi:very-short-patch-repair endonuclease